MLHEVGAVSSILQVQLCGENQERMASMHFIS